MIAFSIISRVSLISSRTEDTMPSIRRSIEQLMVTPRWHGSRDLCELSRVVRPAVRTARQRHARSHGPVDESRLDAVARRYCGGVQVEERLKLGKQPRQRIGARRSARSEDAPLVGTAGLLGDDGQAAQQREQAPPRRRTPQRGGRRQRGASHRSGSP